MKIRCMNCMEEYEDADAPCPKCGYVKGTPPNEIYHLFPEEELAQALKDRKAIAILDRSEMFSATGGPLGAEVRAALHSAKSQAEAVNYLYGLGGRDITVEDFEQVYKRLEEIAQTHEIPDMYEYIGLRSR